MNESINKTTVVTAPEIVCGSCVSSITKVLGNISGIEEIEVDIQLKEVKVSHNESVSREVIVQALDQAGYEAS